MPSIFGAHTSQALEHRITFAFPQRFKRGSLFKSRIGSEQKLQCPPWARSAASADYVFYTRNSSGHVELAGWILPAANHPYGQKHSIAAATVDEFGRDSQNVPDLLARQCASGKSQQEPASSKVHCRIRDLLVPLRHDCAQHVGLVEKKGERIRIGRRDQRILQQFCRRHGHHLLENREGPSQKGRAQPVLLGRLTGGTHKGDTVVGSGRGLSDNSRQLAFGRASTAPAGFHSTRPALRMCSRTRRAADAAEGWKKYHPPARVAALRSSACRLSKAER